MSDHYIHGFSDAERLRLIAQAQMLSTPVFDGLDFSGAQHLLEVGCAVGAELHLLEQRASHLALTGLDLSGRHLQAGRSWLAEHERISLVQGDASSLPFADDSYDIGMTIWLLEHVHDAEGVIRELLRVVKPTGSIILTEVDNHSFGFDPAQPAISAWWDAFNRCQAEIGGGDPYIGSRLRQITEGLGAEVLTEAPRAVISSSDSTRSRADQLHYLRELLESGSERMLTHGYATTEMQRAMATAFDQLRSQPDKAFHYSAVRLICRKPPMH
ncbi:class I SAM-dependent methyltransferase [Halochromatium sp.]